MRTIATQSGQTLFDIALQQYGHAEGVAWLIEDNPDLSISQVPVQGTVVKVRESVLDKEVKSLFTNSKPVTT